MNFLQQLYYLLNHYGYHFFLGTLNTILLAIVGTSVGLLLGMGLALQRNLHGDIKDSKFKRFLKNFASKIALCYIQLFRGTPMMVQAMIIFFGGNALFMSIGSTLRWNAIICGLVVITLNTAAYMAEIVRSGINSVGQGQIEASRSLGMNNFQTMRYIVLPQALRNVIPTIGNELIVNIKDSSVLNVIGVVELYYVGKDAMATSMTVPAFTIIAVIYLILTLLLSQGIKFIEKRLDYATLKKSEELQRELVSYDE